MLLTTRPCGQWFDCKGEFDAIDESGAVYNFGAKETSGGTDPFLLSYNYFLTKVKTLDGDSIVFSYDNEYQFYTASKSQSINAAELIANGCTIPDNSATVSNVQGVSGKRLKQIKSSNGYQLILNMIPIPIQLSLTRSRRLSFGTISMDHNQKLHDSLYTRETIAFLTR